MTTNEEPTLEQRIGELKTSMDEMLRLLGNNPKLVWLWGHVADDLRYAMAAGGIDPKTIRAAEALAKELGATEEQLKLIFPEEQMKWVWPEDIEF